MNFHLVTDNPVYIDTFISKANSLSKEENCFVLIKNGEIKHIKNRNIIQTDVTGALKIIEQQQVGKIFIHYLNSPAIDFLNRIHFKKPVYWMFWGGDGYKHPDLKKNIYLPKTREILSKINPRKGFKGIWDIYKSYIFKSKLEKSLKKIDFCCTQIKGDYNLIMSAVPGLKMQHLFFAYQGIDVISKAPKSPVIREQRLNLLVGNSANPTNNHIDILKILQLHENNIEKIICPLSYAGNDKYIKKVIEYGELKFGKKFIPLTEFLPIKEYEDLMETIDVGVFYHVRQQAFSNTVMILGKNKKILMNSRSTIFKMYKDINTNNVYSHFEELINSDIGNNEHLFKSLGEDIIDNWYLEVLND